VIILNVDEINKYFPFRGGCAFCGHPDARHRIFDAIIERADNNEILADDYECPEAVVKMIKDLKPYRGDK